VWLPPSVVRAQQLEDQAEAQQKRESDRALKLRCDARRADDLAMVAREAEERGEYVSPLSAATGRVTGRSFADVLASAQNADDRQVARAKIDARHESGEHLAFTGALEDPATRSVPAMTATRRAIERASERFTASVAAQRQADQARAALERQLPRLHRPWRRGR
jgi:hypothetical protein